MTPARRVALALGGLALAGGAVALLLSRDDTPPPPSRAAATSAPLTPPTPDTAPSGYMWLPGRVLTWTFTLEERSTVRVPRQNSPPDLWDGDLAIQGRLQWIELGAEPSGAQLVEVRLSDIQLTRLTLSGQPLPVQPGDFNGQSALARYDADGALRTVEVTPGASPVFANITERMLQQVQAPWPNTPNTPTWTRDITGGLGLTRWRAQLHDCDPTRGCEAILRRAADDYASFTFIPPSLAPDARTGDATAQITLASAGHLASIQLDETLHLTRQREPVADLRYHATWALLGTHTLDPAARRAELQRQSFAPAATGDRARLDALKKRVGAWTLEQVLADLKLHGESGRMPDHARWLWQTVGLLLLHPESAKPLANLALEPDTGARTRALVLDLLGSAGNPAAQDAMREVLGADSVRADPAYPALVQRLLLVQEPEEASLAFLEGVYDAADNAPDVRYGAATALGAALSRITSTDPAGAQRRADRLRDDLHSAPDSTGRRALLGALANTRITAYAPDIARHGADPDPEVRAAASNAMESLPSDDAITYLTQVVQHERDPQVQVVAVRALAAHHLSPTQLRALAAAVTLGPLAGRVVGYLIDTCLAFHRNSLDRDSIVTLLLAARTRPGVDPTTQGRLTVALQTLGHPG